MEKTIRYERERCQCCDGSGRVLETFIDDNGYNNKTGRIISCGNCEGSGRAKVPYEWITLNKEEFKEAVDKYKKEKEWLKNQIIIEKKRKGKPWTTETSRFDVDALEGALRDLKYPERSYKVW